ncbi:MAG: phospholipid carrier-dependent glycosyltransferase [Ardenticatenaceae bacterium]|nr:phospholipid carrier-dependent glycosyltransferase [Anaerolineales bacterium]MCB8941922.1 phospholipid carrier-dependent glycosyltransferase [Ardenticatenaceae bacterium]MCB8973036.1 phospholipid carrier-dependent glycosyltransferase [Ardenticatenaceae bacterium]
MKKWQERLCLGLILLVTAVFRFTGIDWDDYHHYHPDERYITWVATTIEWPTDWQTAFSPTESSFNPFQWPPAAASDGIEVPQDQPRDFAYGHVPLYLGVLATRFMERIGPSLAPLFPDDWLFTRDILNQAGLVEFRHLTAVSRALTALFDLGTVWLVFLLGRQLFSPQVGLLAAAFLAVNVMHIQLAHFFISDPYQTFFTVAALLFLIKAVGHREHREKREKPNTDYRSPITGYWLLASVCIGLAVGSKFSAILLVLPLMLAAWWIGKRWDFWLGTAVFTAALTFFITNPFAVLDFGCEVITPAMQIGPISVPALDWGSCYVENIATQNSMVQGRGNIPFTRQYSDTLPYLYFIEMQLRWGMGWLLGLLAFGGFGWAIWQTIRRLEIGRLNPRDWRLKASNLQSPISNLLLLAWTVPLVITSGGFFVKFMRYWQPLTPFLMLWAAAWLCSWRSKWLKWGVGTAVLAFTTLYAISFSNIYAQPHPWVAASEWIFRNVEPGALILSEQWDDSLPSTMPVDGEIRRRSEYPNAELTWLTGADSRDDADKLVANLALLAEADYVTILTNRVYGTVPRLPEPYPISSQYHELLFSGALGYEPVYVVGRSPMIFGWQLRPDTFGWPNLTPPPLVQSYLEAQPGLNGGRADESFIVYDQPLTIIFENVARKTAVELQSLFTIPSE